MSRGNGGGDSFVSFLSFFLSFFFLRSFSFQIPKKKFLYLFHSRIQETHWRFFQSFDWEEALFLEILFWGAFLTNLYFNISLSSPGKEGV